MDSAPQGVLVFPLRCQFTLKKADKHMSKHIKYDLQIVTPGAATGRIKEIYAQIKQDLMQVPEPFSIHSPSPDMLAGVWGIFRESLVAGHVDRGLKEIVAATVAKINRCPWCVDAHSI